MTNQKNLSIPNRVTDIVGNTYGELVVIGYAGKRKDRHLWLCKCSCGKEKIIASGNLKSGHTTTCGHLQRQRASEARKRERTHGLSKHRIRKIYNNMKDRCYNPKNIGYHRYGGRGIRVCQRWHSSFIFFVKDMGLPPSSDYFLERIDNDGNYEPSNCCWATRKQQARNRSSNRMISYKGRTKSLIEWAEQIGISHRVLRARLRSNWSVEKAFTTPVQRYTKRNTPAP